MFILSQAGKNLISVDKIKRIFVDKNILGSKENKFALFVDVGDNSMIGVYPTVEDAIKALEDLSVAISKNETAVYRIPKKNTI